MRGRWGATSLTSLELLRREAGNRAGASSTVNNLKKYAEHFDCIGTECSNSTRCSSDRKCFDVRSRFSATWLCSKPVSCIHRRIGGHRGGLERT